MAEKDRLDESIKRFLDVYRILSPEAKAAFEGQLHAAIRNENDETRKLYEALLKAAKEGMDTEDAIEEMKKTRGET